MEFKKISANLNADIAQKLEKFIEMNPGVSMTFAMNQALSSWLNNPEITLKLKKSQMTEGDIEKFLDDNAELMNDLAR